MFKALSLPIHCTHSSMDRMADSGSADVGSTPAGYTKAFRLGGFFYEAQTNTPGFHVYYKNQ